MTQEDKELLLKDLCVRLPYGVICKDDYAKVEGKLSQIGINYDMCLLSDDYGKTEWAYIPNCKPYLYPLSSMTEEQLYEVSQILGKDVAIFTDYLLTIDHCRRTFSYQELDALLNWFDKNHFDYRGLIPMGLANNATGLNIY